jgi:hypothetical protein
LIKAHILDHVQFHHCPGQSWSDGLKEPADKHPNGLQLLTVNLVSTETRR